MRPKNKEDDEYMITVGLVVIMIGVVLVALGANKQ